MARIKGQNPHGTRVTFGQDGRVTISGTVARAVSILAAVALAGVAVAILQPHLAGRDERVVAAAAAAEKQILAAHDQMIAAAEALDVEQLYRHVLDCSWPVVANGQILATREAALAQTRENFRNIAALKYTFSERHVTLLNPDTTLLVTRGTSTVRTTDGREFNAPFAQSLVLLRKNAEWRVVHSHQSAPPR